MSTLDVVVTFVGIPLLAFLVITLVVLRLTRPRKTVDASGPAETAPEPDEDGDQ